MATRYMVPLENQTTLRLNIWFSNVKSIKKEYENIGVCACKHCNEASNTYYAKEILDYNKCAVCIWQTLDSYACGRIGRSNNFYFNSFHKAIKHTTRCDKCIDILEKELERRNKNVQTV